MFISAILYALFFDSYSDWKFCEIGGVAFSTGFVFNSVLYLQTYGDEDMLPRMYRSFNDGETWEQTELPFLNSSIVGKVYSNSNSDYYLFITSTGVYRVNKDGTGVLHSRSFSCVDIDGKSFSKEWDSPYYLQFVEIGTKWFTASTLGIVQSADSGRTWSLQQPCLLSEDEWNCENSDYYFTNALTGSSTSLIVGITNGVLKSSDSGQTWESDSFSSSDVLFLKTASVSELFAITENKGIYISSDSGETWHSANNNYPQLTSGLYEKIKDVIVFKNQIYIAIRSGVFTYKDQKWQNIGNNLPSGVFPIRFFSSQQSLFCITNDGLCVLRNGDWQLSGSSFSGAKIGINTVVSHKGNIWAGGKGGTYMSSDAGKTWKNRTAGIDDEPVVMDLLSCKYGLFAAVMDNGLYMWDDSNQIWKPVRFGVRNDFKFGELFEIEQYKNGIIGVQPYNAKTLYFDLEKNTIDSINSYHSYTVSVVDDTVLQSNYNVIIGSVNGGQTWDSITSVTYASNILKNRNLILISTAYLPLVYISTDNGISWSTKSFRSDLSQGDNLTYSLGDYYVLSKKYLYYSKDTCKTWDSISCPPEMQNGWFRPLCIDGDIVAVGGDKGLWFNSLSELMETSNKISPIQIVSPKIRVEIKTPGCLEFNIAKKSMVSVEIYDLQGRVKSNLVNNIFNPGVQRYSLSSIMASGTNIVNVKVDGCTVANFKVVLSK